MLPAPQQPLEGEPPERRQGKAYICVARRAPERSCDQLDELIHVSVEQLAQGRILIGFDEQTYETAHAAGRRDRSIHRNQDLFGVILTRPDFRKVVGYVSKKAIGERHQQIGTPREVVGQVRLPDPQDLGHFGLGETLGTLLLEDFGGGIDDALA